MRTPDVIWVVEMWDYGKWHFMRYAQHRSVALRLLQHLAAVNSGSCRLVKYTRSGVVTVGETQKAR